MYTVYEINCLKGQKLRLSAEGDLLLGLIKTLADEIITLKLRVDELEKENLQYLDLSRNV